jgi:hypothetical protein
VNPPSIRHLVIDLHYAFSFTIRESENEILERLFSQYLRHLDHKFILALQLSSKICLGTTDAFCPDDVRHVIVRGRAIRSSHSAHKISLLGIDKEVTMRGPRAGSFREVEWDLYFDDQVLRFGRKSLGNVSRTEMATGRRRSRNPQCVARKI